MEPLIWLDKDESEFLGKLIKKGPFEYYGIESLEFKRDLRTLQVFGTNKEIALYTELYPYELGEFEQFRMDLHDLEKIRVKRGEVITMNLDIAEKKILVEIGNRTFKISYLEPETKLKIAKLIEDFENKNKYIEMDIKTLKDALRVAGDFPIEIRADYREVTLKVGEIEVLAVSNYLSNNLVYRIEKRIVQKFKGLLSMFTYGTLKIWINEEKKIFGLELNGKFRKSSNTFTIWFFGPIGIEEIKEEEEERTKEIMKSYNCDLGVVLQKINPKLFEEVTIKFNSKDQKIRISQLDPSLVACFTAEIEASRIPEDLIMEISAEELAKISKIKEFGEFKVLEKDGKPIIEFLTEKGKIKLYGEYSDYFKFFEVPIGPNWIKLPAEIFKEAIKSCDGFTDSDNSLYLRFTEDPIRKLVISSANARNQYIAELTIDDNPTQGLYVEEPSVSVFNYVYLLDLLKNVKKEDIVVYAGKNKPLGIEIEKLGYWIKMFIAPLSDVEETPEEKVEENQNQPKAVKEPEVIEEPIEDPATEEPEAEEPEEIEVKEPEVIEDQPEDSTTEEIEEPEKEPRAKKIIRIVKPRIEENKRLEEDYKRLADCYKDYKRLADYYNELLVENRELKEEIKRLKQEIEELRSQKAKPEIPQEVIEEIKRAKQEVIKELTEIKKEIKEHKAIEEIRRAKEWTIRTFYSNNKPKRKRKLLKKTIGVLTSLITSSLKLSISFVKFLIF